MNTRSLDEIIEDHQYMPARGGSRDIGALLSMIERVETLHRRVGRCVSCNVPAPCPTLLALRPELGQSSTIETLLQRWNDVVDDLGGKQRDMSFTIFPSDGEAYGFEEWDRRRHSRFTVGHHGYLTEGAIHLDFPFSDGLPVPVDVAVGHTLSRVLYDLQPWSAEIEVNPDDHDVNQLAAVERGCDLARDLDQWLRERR